MGSETGIAWCDHTWNPWMGCTKVGPPCDHCYAESLMDARYGKVRWGTGQPRIRTAPANWNLPFKWDRAAAIAGRPAKVFCLSLGDIWDNEVEPAWRCEAFDVMRQTPHLIYLLLSKRIGNAERMAAEAGGLPANAALGATMANQFEYDRDRIKLRRAGEALGALFTFASIEPMLGLVILDCNRPDWIIAGGESGPGARPMAREWASSLERQSRALGAAFFFKQSGSNRSMAWPPGITGKGDNPEQWPPELRVQQFPDALRRDGADLGGKG